MEFYGAGASLIGREAVRMLAFGNYLAARLQLNLRATRRFVHFLKFLSSSYSDFCRRRPCKRGPAGVR